MPPKTITITPIEGHNALRMHWNKIVRGEDVKRAFQELYDTLQRSETPLYILIVLEQGIHLPVNLTTSQALPIHQHPQLGAWLVVSDSPLAKIVDNVLYSITRRRVTQWFNSEEQALAYLHNTLASESTLGN